MPSPSAEMNREPTRVRKRIQRLHLEHRGFAAPQVAPHAYQLPHVDHDERSRQGVRFDVAWSGRGVGADPGKSSPVCLSTECRAVDTTAAWHSVSCGSVVLEHVLYISGKVAGRYLVCRFNLCVDWSPYSQLGRLLVRGRAPIGYYFEPTHDSELRGEWKSTRKSICIIPGKEGVNKYDRTGGTA